MRKRKIHTAKQMKNKSGKIIQDEVVIRKRRIFRGDPKYRQNVNV